MIAIWTAITSFLSLRKLEIYGVAIVGIALFAVWQGARLQSWRDASEIASIKAKAQTDIASAIVATQQQCQHNQLITWEIDNAFQKDFHTIGSRVNADLQRLPAETNSNRVPASRPASEHHAGTGRTERPGYCGVDLRPVFTIAGQCDQWKAELKACQAFIKAERKH